MVDTPARKACFPVDELGKVSTEFAELSVDRLGQCGHAGDGTQRNNQTDEYVLKRILAGFFLKQILQYIDHLSNLLLTTLIC